MLLHNHMGGSVITSMHSDRKAAAHLAKAAGARSLVLNFRRSPEHKYPAQIDDVVTAYEWLLEQGYQPNNIASVGHSIGGYLAVSLALRLRDRGAPLPAAILSISPLCDPTLSGNSIETNADRDKLLTRGLLEFFRSCWLDGTGVDFTDPQVNLLNADLSGLPPIAVFYGEDELLVSEAVEFGLRAQRAGNEVTVRRVEAGQHSFIMGAGPGARGRSGDQRDGQLAAFEAGAPAGQCLTRGTELLPRYPAPCSRPLIAGRARRRALASDRRGAWADRSPRSPR